MDKLNQNTALVHEGNQPLRCSKCETCVSRTTIFKKLLIKRHNKSVHEKIKLFKIEHIDDASFEIEYGKDGHISSIHETKKLFSCDICHVNFGHRSILKNHTSTVHGVHEGKKAFSCKLCMKTFTGKPWHARFNLNVHIKTVHEGRKLRNLKKTFECEICKAKFASKQGMTYHIDSVHGKKKPFKCQICNDKFASKQGMNYHIALVHEGKKATQL